MSVVAFGLLIQESRQGFCGCGWHCFHRLAVATDADLLQPALNVCPGLIEAFFTHVAVDPGQEADDQFEGAIMQARVY